MADIEQSPPTGTAGAAAEEWAQVEIFGHRVHHGRCTEVDRFGSKLLRIDVPTADADVFETVFYGGGSIFSYVPCTEESARAWAARQRPRVYAPSSRLPPPPDLDPNGEGLDGVDRG